MKQPLTPITEIAQRLKRSSIRQLADELQVSPGYLGDVISGRRPPSERLADALGLECLVRYRRKRDDSVRAA